MHRHVRLLVDAGLLESTGVRQGPSGAYEKPYRSTGLSWRLSFDHVAEDEENSGEAAMMGAFRQELAEAGNTSVAEMTRFQLHLDDEAVVEFIDEFKTFVRRYVDERRAGDDAISYGGIFVLHRMAGDG